MPAWILPAALAAAQLGGGFLAQRSQAKANRRAADRAYQRDLELMKYQLDYNSPANQMKRFEEAGLNPNLIYGQGSPGNLDAPPRYQKEQVPEHLAQTLGNIGTHFQQARLMSNQADLIDQKVQESGIKQDLMKAQKDLIRANPNLRPEYVNALVTQLQSVAALKKQESDFMLQQVTGSGHPTLDRSGSQSVGFIKMDRELQLLFQKFDLNNADKAIKARVMESKEFQNELQRIQVEWMKDGEITPQHIYMGIMMLLQKMM